ncbi:MAG: SIMPL domain-containing protein [Candidatus Falkowbacteria bacterium]
MEKEQVCCSGHKAPKIIMMIIGMVLLTGIITVAILRDRIVNQPQYQVSVVGQGKVSYQPDVANVTIGIQIDKVAKADEALKQLNEKMNNVVNALKAAGIKDEDLKTQNYSLLPQYDYINNVSTSSGYNANEQLVVKVNNIKTDPSLVGKAVEAASKVGANQIIGITYDVSNLEELKQQARIMAISDAKNKANVLARAAGVGLGDIVGWWENLIQAPGISTPYYDSAKGGMGGGGAVAPSLPNGNQDIVTEISVSYRIK